MFVRARVAHTNPLQTNARRRLPSVGMATTLPAAATADAARGQFASVANSKQFRRTIQPTF